MSAPISNDSGHISRPEEAVGLMGVHNYLDLYVI
jgi:hypothetical protein